MKNILDIDVKKTCFCSLVTCIDDGTARLFLNIESDLSLNPVLEYGTTKTSLTTSPQLIEIASSQFRGTGTFQFRVVDDSRTGNYFSIKKIATIDKTLTLKQISEYSYEFSIYVEPITVQELDEKVEEVKTNVGKLETSFTNFSNDFDDLSSDFTGLSKNFNTYSSNFDKLKTQSLKNNGILDKIYPVGSIYMSTSSTNPSTYFGGTWSAWGSGRVPVGVSSGDSDFGSAEKTGGSKTHTLSANEMPSHKHTVDGGSCDISSSGEHYHYGFFRNDISSSGSAEVLCTTGNSNKDGTANSAITTTSGKHTHTVPNHSHNVSNTGGGQAHNNLQPYITCYMWKRTA